MSRLSSRIVLASRIGAGTSNAIDAMAPAV